MGKLINAFKTVYYLKWMVLGIAFVWLAAWTHFVIIACCISGAFLITALFSAVRQYG